MFRFLNITVISFTAALVIFALIPTVYAITTVTKFKADYEQKIVQSPIVNNDSLDWINAAN